MAGAIAGTAILNIDSKKKNNLQTIALTVNNACNLICGHCYLQDGTNADYVSDEVVDKIIDSSASHIALVGKEPTVHLRKTERLIQKLSKAGKSVSMITNGLQLHKLNKDALMMLDYVDISMDGGPTTYTRGEYDKILKNLNLHPRTNILHTLYKENLENIDDMLQVPYTGVMMFSPYLVTNNRGENTVHRSELVDVIDSFAKSSVRSDKNAFLLIDSYHLEQEGILKSFDDQPNGVFDDESGIFKGVIQDPLEMGIVRVNYDGRVLKPADSLHPLHYKQNSIPIGDVDMQYLALLN